MYTELIAAVGFFVLLFFVPIWWVLRGAGWRRYLRIRSNWLGCAAEMASALVLTVGVLFIFPWPVFWVFERLCDLTGNHSYGFIVAGHWPWYVNLYPAALVVFLGYLWKKRNP